MIVAGGAGGANNNSSNDYNYNNFGGGACGGVQLSHSNDTTDGLYASQTSGFNFGGTAQVPIKKTTSIPGAGGGGGGWFTGYSSQLAGTTGTDKGGGGGSGYVHTSTSHKPDGWLLTSDHYMSNTYLGCGQSEFGCVKICKPILPKELLSGDVITAFSQAG